VEDRRDDAEAAEDVVHDNDAIGPETPEADALEQGTDVRSGEDDERAGIGDAPEADALEQRRAAGDDEEDEDRR
jgi:hypothetical protein